MLTELQEPTSFSVLAEHAAFGVSEDVATLGLGWDLALSCFDLRGRRDSLGELITEPRPAGSGCSLQQLFPFEAADYFGAVLVTCRRGTLALGPPCFAVLVVAAGAGEVRFAEEANRSSTARPGSRRTVLGRSSSLATSCR